MKKEWWIKMKEGAWINSRDGKFAWVDEHASWIQKKDNAGKIGLNGTAYDRLKDLKWDFDGEGRQAILLIAMNAGLIRMRGHGSYWTFEFTIGTQVALWSCFDFLENFSGPLTQCRFNNLRTGEQIGMPYAEFCASMTEDPEIVMRIASVIEPTSRYAAFKDAAASDARKDALAKKYGVGRWLAEMCGEADPTPNGTYTEWLVKQMKAAATFATSPEKPSQDDYIQNKLSSLSEMLVEFSRLKNSRGWVQEATRELGKDAANIMSYTLQEFEDVIHSISVADLSKNEQERELQRRRQQYLDEGCTFLGTPREGFACFWPQTIQALKLMGEGSHWCTQGGYANKYFMSGDVYVFTTDENRTASNYDSDRYAQLYVESDGEKIEIQNVDGHDLYSSEYGGRSFSVSDEAWWMIEFVAQHNTTLAQMIKKRLVHGEGDDGPDFTLCSLCKSVIDENSDDYISVEDPTGDLNWANFCSPRCFQDYYDTYRTDTVEELMEDHIDTSDVSKAEAEWALMRDDPETIDDPILKKVIEAFNRAIPAKDIRNTKTGDLLTDYEPGWALSNIKAVQSMKQNRTRHDMPPEEIEAELTAKIDKVTPGLTLSDWEHADGPIRILFDRANDADRQMDEAQNYVKENFDWNDMDIHKILQEGDFLPKSVGVQSSLLHRAKAITLDGHFLDKFMEMMGNLFAHVYQHGDDSEQLKQITRRDTSWQLDENDWKKYGIQFVRAGDEVLNSLLIVIQCDPNKVPSGPAKPVIFAGSLLNAETPVMSFLVNGNLTKGEALAQFDMQNPEYSNIRTAIRHEFVHLYDRARTTEESHLSEDMLGDDNIYFNQSTEVRAWTGNLLDEFHQYLTQQKGELENELIDAFLRESRVWGILSQHLNSQNRHAVLRELGRDLVNQRSRTHARKRKMDG